MPPKLPDDPPALLQYILARLNDRLAQLTGAGVGQDALHELLQLTRAIVTPLSQTDSRSRWREFMSDRDLEALENLIRQVTTNTGDVGAPALVELLEQLVDQIEWCLEGLGVESDLRVLRDRLAETDISSVQRQLHVVDRLEDVLAEVFTQTQQRLNQAVAVRPKGTAKERRQLLETLATLQTGLVEIINSAASAGDALRPYRNFLTGEETSVALAVRGRRRAAFEQALERVLTALDQELPPLPPDLQQSLVSEGYFFGLIWDARRLPGWGRQRVCRAKKGCLQIERQ